MFYVKYIIFFILFVSIHLIEQIPTPLGIPFTQLWKIPLLFIIIIMVFFLNKKKTMSFQTVSYFLFVGCLLNIDTITNTLSNIALAAKVLVLPLFFSFYSLFKDNKKLYNFTIYLSQYICLSSLLVLLGIVTPIKEFSSAESFGVDNLVYYSGIFGITHAASSYFVIAVLILIYDIKYNPNRKRIRFIFNAFLILVGVYSIYLTYVRTGWLMLVIGIICLSIPKKISFKYVAKFFFKVVGILLILLYVYSTDEAFQHRLQGVNVYNNVSSSSIDLNGSGRVDFWKNGLDLISESSFTEQLFGCGYGKVVDNNYKKMGIAVFSHNQFVDTFVQNGLISLILLCSYFILLYKYIKKRKKSRYYMLAISIYACSLIFSFFQNEMYFDFAILFSAILCLINSPETYECE